MGSVLLHCLEFSCPNLLFVCCLNLLGPCVTYFFASVGSLCGSLKNIYLFSVPYFRMACDHGNSFICLEELEIEGGTGY